MELVNNFMSLEQRLGKIRHYDAACFIETAHHFCCKAVTSPSAKSAPPEVKFPRNLAKWTPKVCWLVFSFLPWL